MTDYYSQFVKEADAAGFPVTAVCARAGVAFSTIMRNREGAQMTERVYNKLREAIAALARDEVRRSRRRIRRLQQAGLA